MLTFVLFVVVFGGMVFVHEFGHFIVARLFKIPVDEFGFGFPPRLLRLWRNKGSLVIDGQTIEIPANFDLPFEREDGLHQRVKASADRVGERLVLRTIALVQDEIPTQPSTQPPQLTLEPNSKPVQDMSAMLRGAIELSGSLTIIDTGTEITLNALPLGGFVRPRGENDPDVPDGLAAANPWKRLGVLFAGPLMNLLTAVVVLAIVIAQSGIAVPGSVKVAEVTSDSPAAQAGLQPNDIIKSINGTAVSEIDATRTLIRQNLDKSITLLIERDGQQVTIVATPLSSRTAEQGALGVALSNPTRPATLGESILGGFTLTGLQAVGIMYMPIGLIQGAIAPSDARLVGLKGIYDFFGQAIQRDVQTRAQTSQTGSQPASGGNSEPASPPSNYVLELIAMLSISLGVFNLFPIPALDGGRILFTLPEIIFRRRIPIRFENAVNSVAFMLLIGLMLVVNVMDFINPINTKLP